MIDRRIPKIPKACAVPLTKSKSKSAELPVCSSSRYLKNSTLLFGAVSQTSTQGEHPKRRHQHEITAPLEISAVILHNLDLDQALLDDNRAKANLQYNTAAPCSHHMHTPLSKFQSSNRFEVFRSTSGVRLLS